VVDVDVAPQAEGPWQRPEVKVEQPSNGGTRSTRQRMGSLRQPFQSMRTRLAGKRR